MRHLYTTLTSSLGARFKLIVVSPFALEVTRSVAFLR